MLKWIMAWVVIRGTIVNFTRITIIKIAIECFIVVIKSIVMELIAIKVELVIVIIMAIINDIKNVIVVIIITSVLTTIGVVATFITIVLMAISRLTFGVVLWLENIVDSSTLAWFTGIPTNLVVVIIIMKAIKAVIKLNPAIISFVLLT
jgi:hypothetical protein